MRSALNDRRLAELAAEIYRLESEVVELERDALAVRGSEADCLARQRVVDDARASLERALRAYFIESEVVRRGDARRVAA